MHKLAYVPWWLFNIGATCWQILTVCGAGLGLRDPSSEQPPYKPLSTSNAWIRRKDFNSSLKMIPPLDSLTWPYHP